MNTGSYRRLKELEYKYITGLSLLTKRRLLYVIANLIGLVNVIRSYPRIIARFQMI